WHTSDALHDARVRSFAERVSVREYDDAGPILAKLLRDQGHAELIPTAASLTARGTTYTATTDHAIGDPWDENGAFSDASLEDQFRTVWRSSLPEVQIEDAIARVRRLAD